LGAGIDPGIALKPSSIGWNLNSRPSNHASSMLTTRPDICPIYTLKIIVTNWILFEFLKLLAERSALYLNLISTFSLRIIKLISTWDNIGSIRVFTILHSSILSISTILISSKQSGNRKFTFPMPKMLNFRCQFYQHFKHAFFKQKCLAKLFFSYSLPSSFFGANILAKKLLVKCWWNLLQYVTVPNVLVRIDPGGQILYMLR